MNKIKELQRKIHQFSKERDWLGYHQGKDLAISIALEANELLECFQWVSSEEAIKNNMDNIKDELADVLIYCFRFMDAYDIDLETIVLNKLEKNAIKYPIKK